MIRGTLVVVVAGTEGDDLDDCNSNKHFGAG